MIRRSGAVALIVCLSLVLNLFTMVNVSAAVTEAPISISRKVTPSGNIYAGEQVTITYTLTPDKIKADVPNDKEIVIVMDKSGSMGWDLAGNKYGISNSKKRMTIARNAANNFVESLKDEDNVKVAYVRYDSYADLINDSSPFYSMGNSSHVTKLKSYISGTKANGGTNIGDGMRLAYHALYNKGSATADKFIVLLTDGEPTIYTANENDNGYYYGTATTSKNYDIKNSDSKGLTYAKNWAAKYDDKTVPVNGYFIAFSTNGANDLKAVSDNASGSFYDIATTETALNSIYSTISEQIAKYTPITDMYFEETFPEGVTIIEKPSEMIVNGLTVNWDVPPLQYELNEAETYYEAAPVDFSIKIAAGEAGDFKVGGGESFISYTDLDGITPRKKEFTSGSFEIHEINTPTINMSQDPSASAKEFTLTHNGTGNMHFDGDNDYVEFPATDTWHDSVFGSSSSAWTVNAVIKPESLNGEFTNHKIQNVFLAKASDNKNDNLELGINSATNELMIYIDAKGADTYTNVPDTYIHEDQFNDIVVSYDAGKVTVSVNGKETEVSNWMSSTVMDGASGSPLTIGASLHIDNYFDGMVNKVTFYDEVTDRDEIYNGSAPSPVASYIAEKITSETSLPDDSGNGHSGIPRNGAFLQAPTGDTVKLEYMLESDGTWIDYPNDAVEAISNPGSEKVFARAYIERGGSKVNGNATDKTAVMEEGYIDKIEMVASDTNIELDESIVVTYTITGSEVPISALSATSDFGPIAVEIDVPAGSTPSNIDLDDYSYSGGKIRGTINSRMVKSGSDFKFEDVTFDIRFTPQSTANIVLPKDSVDLSYTDFNNDNQGLTGGNSLSVIVTPNKPTINDFGTDVGGVMTIDRRVASAYVFTGTADPDSDPATVTDDDQTLVLKVTLLDDTGAPTGHEMTVNATVDSAGNYVADPVDLSGWEGDIQVEITATDSPAHGGDAISSARDGRVTLIFVDIFDIL